VILQFCEFNYKKSCQEKAELTGAGLFGDLLAFRFWRLGRHLEKFDLGEYRQLPPLGMKKGAENDSLSDVVACGANASSGAI